MGNIQGSSLETVMADKGLTDRGLAYLSKLSAPYVCRIRRGDRVPSREAVFALAKALHMSPEEVELLLPKGVAK